MTFYGGINLPDPPEGEIALEAVVLVRCLAADGSLKYREWKSTTLHPVEALGMVTTFSDTLRELLMKNSRPAPPPT
jgi:hypothetical protein